MTEWNNEELKEMMLFHRRCKDIGINGLTQERFLEKIKELSQSTTFEFCYKQPKEKIFIGKKVVIVDIRNNPNVKRDFRPNDLIELGKIHNFKYKYYDELGNPFYKRHREEKNPKKAKQEYQSYILSNSKAKKQFMTLYDELYHHQIFIFMCYCPIERPINPKDPGECHRFWLVELLEKQKRVTLQKKREIDAYLKTEEEVITQ